MSRRKFIKDSALLASAALLGPTANAANLVQQSSPKIKPPALKPGDTVAISSPAGAVWDAKQIDTFTAILNGFGFKVIYGQTLKEKHGYFAGKDELRAAEINALFANPEVKGIFCMKGGWGCARILDLIDYNVIAKNPKVIIGFSDITALLLAINKMTGLVTFHGPVGNSGWNDFTKEVFSNVVMKTAATYTFPFPFDAEPAETVHPGKATGILAGGNLTVLTGLIGSKYLPDWKYKILFLEEAKEEPYSVDRMLTQLKLANVLGQLNGFVFGKCSKCLAEEPEKAFTFNEVLLQHVQPLKITAFSGAMIGHIENKLTVPIGVLATVDSVQRSIRLDEAAVI